MNARKNRIPKYRELQLLLDYRKINPQNLQKNNSLSLK